MKEAAMWGLVAALGAATSTAASADRAGLVTEHSISLDAAMRMATTSLERCRADG